MLMLGTISLSAQEHVEDPTAAIQPANTAMEQQLRQEMGCVCGTCAHEPLTKCTCSTAQHMRAQLRAELDQGKSHDQVVDAFIALYGGQQFLSAPLDRGFNRLAWL